jgi:hypothetical protein
MAQMTLSNRAHCSTTWCDLLPDAEWSIYREVIEALHRLEVPFALGGAFAVASYTGAWRDTKDLDIYILPQYREKTVGILTSLGLADIFEKSPYDRWWIYRSSRGDTIVDVIWAMANHRARIDELWMSGPEIEIRGSRVKILPVEAMLWDKLYIMQRERCDWPDVLNLLYAAGDSVDWEYLLFRIGEDVPLMAGVLSVSRWIAPGRAQSLPAWVWARVGLTAGPGAAAPEIDRRRVKLLDRRPWFGPDRGQPPREGSNNGAKC